MKNIENNPLFKALNGKTRKRRERSDKAGKSSGKVNPLEKALHGANSRISKPTNNKIKRSINPLALALSLDSGAKGVENGNSSVEAFRGHKSRHHAKLQRRSGSKIQIANEDDQNSEEKKEGDVVRTIGRTKLAKRERKVKTQVNFEGASKLSFLRLSNLSPLVTESDVSAIMSRYGTVLKVMMLKADRAGYGYSTTAELFYLAENSMYKAQDALGGNVADHRQLKIEIAQDPLTIVNDKTWNQIVKEIKFIRNERTTKTAKSAKLYA